MFRTTVVFAALVTLCMGHYAVVQIRGANNVHGTLRFTKNEHGLVCIDGEISGLKPGRHGFHVHEYGDIGNGCKSAGGHFNPYKYNHGAPTDQERHVGDLGNIVANELGVAYVSIVDKVIDLEGPNNVIGRSVVVHEGEDDLGRGGYDDSLTTGHAGDRAGCGIIEGFHGYY